MPPKKAQPTVAKSKAYFGLSGAVYPRLQKDITFELCNKNIVGPRKAGNDKWNALLDRYRTTMFLKANRPNSVKIRTPLDITYLYSV